MKKEKLWTNKEWLHNEYVVLKKTQKQIAEENDTGISTICRWMKNCGIEIRPVSQTSSENKKKFWSNEENKDKYLRGENNPAKRPEVRKKLSKTVEEYWNGNKERKSQMSERSKLIWTDEKRELQRTKMEETNVLNWSCPNYRKKMSEISLRTWNDPSYINSASKILEALKGVWNDPDFRERASFRAREASRKRLETIGVSFPSYNRSSISIIENFAAFLGEHVSHAENDGEIRIANYWLDGYIPSKNIAIEYDECHHFKKNGDLLEKDIKRMKRIHKEIKCTFVRIKYDGMITIYDENWFLTQEE